MIKRALLSLLYLYQFIFARSVFYPLFSIIYQLALRGMGIFNYQNTYISGEDYLLKRIAHYFKKKHIKTITVFDVGANKGDYIITAKEILGNSVIYAFEPNPRLYTTLRKHSNNNVHIYNNGFGDKVNTMILYDVVSQGGSPHASLYEDVIHTCHGMKPKKISVEIDTIDRFCWKKKIDRIQLLKADTEGNEYNIFRGARRMIEENKIDFIQFEFNSMNVFSRVYYKDFLNYLKNYNLYRLMPDGMIPLTHYNPSTMEIFAYQNIVAINKNIGII